LDLHERIHSPEFAQEARHPDSPNAFTRCRKLPLPALIASLLCLRVQSQQVSLDSFFASLCGHASLCRGISDRGFAAARSRLHVPALEGLNDFLVSRADAGGLVRRWRGMRVVAGDGSVLMPAVRRCHLARSAASADQRLFALYLPGAELTLHASVYSAEGSERQMLVEALDRLKPGDVLVLDRGYPAAWLVNLLLERGISFCIRCDGSWAAAARLARGRADDEWVTLNAPSVQDAEIWGCSRARPRLRLVKQIAPNGAVRVMATNLDAQAVPAQAFGELYHQRWRIEEAFKRLKHRMKLESVSGLSQHALMIDVAAKILADNIASLLCNAAAEQAGWDADAHLATQPTRRCNRTYAADAIRRVLPRLLLIVGDFFAQAAELLDQLVGVWQRFVPGRSRPRKPSHVKPHPSLAYKG